MRNIILSCVVLLMECCSLQQNKPIITYQKVTYDTSKIAIIPFDTSVAYLFKEEKISSYNLSQQDLSDIDKLIDESVNRYNTAISEESMKFLRVDLKKNKYHRQYVSVINQRN